MSKRSFRLVALLASAMLIISFGLAGCGGSTGGSSDSGSAFPALGALAGATVNVVATSGDNTGLTFPISLGTTDSTGELASFSNIDQFSSSQYPLFVSVQNGTTPSGGTFSGELKGILKSPTSNVFITPASTLVVSLVDNDLSVEEAETLVRSYVQNTMGFGADVDPLGDFTVSDEAQQNIEIAQYGLMVLLGFDKAVEGDATVQTELAPRITNLAAAIAGGDSFTDAVKAINSQLPDDLNVATFIEDNIGVIVDYAETGLNETIPEANVPDIDTSDKAEAILIADSGATNADDAEDNGNNVSVGINTETDFKVFVTTADGSWDSAPSFQFTAISGIEVVDDSDESITLNTDYDDGDTFTLIAPETPGEASITVRTNVGNGVELTRTINFTIGDADTTVISVDFTWYEDSRLMPFDGTGSVIADGDDYDVVDYMLNADFHLLDGAQSNNDDAVTAKYRVSYQAPAGFKFQVGDDSNLYSNCDLYTLEGDGDSNYTANVTSDLDVSVVSDGENTFGLKTFVAKLIDKTTGMVERKVSKGFYVVSGSRAGEPARIDTVKFIQDGDDAITDPLSAENGVVTFAGDARFTGRVLTWTDLAGLAGADPDDENSYTPSGPEENMYGEWTLLAGPSSGDDYGFMPTGQTVNNASIVTAADYEDAVVTIDVPAWTFTANTAINSDKITLQYVDTDNEINIKSIGGFTLKTD